MIAHRISGLHLLLFFFSVSLAFLFYWIWYGFFFFSRGQIGELAQFRTYLLLSFVIGLGLTLDYVLNVRLMEESRMPTERLTTAMVRTGRQLAITATLLLSYILAALPELSRGFLASYIVLLFLLLFTINRYFPSRLARSLYQSAQRYRVLISGNNQARLAELKPWVDRVSEVGFDFLGIVSPRDNSALKGVETLGKIEHIDQVFREKKAHVLLYAGIPQSDEHMGWLRERCDDHGVRLMLTCGLNPGTGQAQLIESEGMQFLSFRPEPLENPVNQLLKRTLDLFVASTAILTVMPFIALLVWLVQRIQSPGPLFYYQERVGVNGARFTMIKFRSMHHNNGVPEDRQAVRGDPRIYPFGTILRKFSLDEIPQFLNVFLGDMSVVGPRPHLYEHDEAFSRISRHYKVRSFVKPGITGLSQIRGLRGETAEEKAVIDRTNSDVFYLENWSLFLDLKIMVQTSYQVLCPPKSAL